MSCAAGAATCVISSNVDTISTAAGMSETVSACSIEGNGRLFVGIAVSYSDRASGGTSAVSKPEIVNAANSVVFSPIGGWAVSRLSVVDGTWPTCVVHDVGEDLCTP